MNPHQVKSISPLALLRSINENRKLILSLVKRDVLGRYRGSAVGILWSFFNPILMLVVYTFVFSVVFKARWTGGSDSKTEFALVLFSGLMIFNLFSECIIRAPSLILANVNYVKKVVFPLEILPLVALGTAGFHLVISFFVWLLFYLYFFGVPPATILLIPVVLLPLVLMIVGFSWFLASLGVYLRDVSQVVGVLVTVLMFMSPVFYPTDILPEQFQSVMRLSPLTIVIEQARSSMIWGNLGGWLEWLVHLAVSVAVFFLGFAWFQKTRKGFADVI